MTRIPWIPLSDPNERKTVRRELLKIEQLHALSRDVHYAKRGRIYETDAFEQRIACCCLTLVLACIAYYQARELDRIVNEYSDELALKNIDVSLIEHISPIGWNTVIIYGDYILDPRKLTQ